MLYWKEKIKLRKQFSWKFMNDWTKSRFEVIVTSYGGIKNLDDEIKQETANNILSYRFAAINNKYNQSQ